MFTIIKLGVLGYKKIFKNASPVSELCLKKNFANGACRSVVGVCYRCISPFRKMYYFTQNTYFLSTRIVFRAHWASTVDRFDKTVNKIWRRYIIFMHFKLQKIKARKSQLILFPKYFQMKFSFLKLDLIRRIQYGVPKL